MNAKDATTQLWLFGELVKNKPAKGSNDYPVAIKAVHLDENYRRSTLVAPDDSVQAGGDLYEVKYDADGTRITRIFANGQARGDLLYWNGVQWFPFQGIESKTLHVLGIKDGALQWVETQDCPE